MEYARGAAATGARPSGPDVRPWVLIPAYKPDEELLRLVGALADSPVVQAVVVVDDGSGGQYAAIFARLARIARCSVVSHVTNLGKGAALRTGLNYGATRLSDSVGCVTADADGQHRLEDILRVAARLAEAPRSLVLGARAFEGEVPLRSRFGNRVTRTTLRLVTGLRLSDTQTGLRGIPAAFIPDIVRLRSSGYDFEMEMLLEAHRVKVVVVEEPIATIYTDNNSGSHFSPLLDSMRVYFVLLRFAAVSLLTAGVDFVVFAVSMWMAPNVLLAMAAGRAAAIAFNYHSNRKIVFRSRSTSRWTFPGYLALVIFSGLVSYALMQLLGNLAALPVLASKVVAESIVFVFNFAVQRDLIFRGRGDVE
ncbi:MAG: bifunctional glycosyltransferase family 2/GtrA family protein [Planctomycetaceae bacterium]|nr:bifunctional glycosyltransferase family 2/GtrA family protein [Planctomycetaceae bacterium]